MIARRVLLALAAGLAGATATPCLAQSTDKFPDKPITILVGFAPGGTSDVSARILADHMSRTLKVAVLVDNKPGAGGSIAAAATTHLAPDGYKIYLADPGAYAINPIMLPQNARYDPVKDFTGIALVGQSPLVVVVPAGKPFRTVADLNAHLKANAGTANYASSGSAGIAQFGAELYLKRSGDLSALHVPYRGGAPMMEALTKGETDFGVAVLASAMPMIEAGTVRPLALAAPSTTPAVTRLPLLEDLGLKGATMTSWVIMMGPPGMPSDVVGKLNAAINEALADASVRERLLKAGIEAYPPATPAQTDTYLHQEVTRYRSYTSELGERLTK